MKFFCIADEDTVRGFALAGVHGTTVSTPAQATAALRSTAARADYGIIIITDDVADTIPRQLEAFRSERAIPLIVQIPAPQKSTTRHKTLSDLVNQAVGVHITNHERE